MIILLRNIQMLDFYCRMSASSCGSILKVIISRPQSVFTKAYVVIDKENESLVLNSEYGKCFRFLARGRYQERQPDGSLLSDTGDE